MLKLAHVTHVFYLAKVFKHSSQDCTAVIDSTLQLPVKPLKLFINLNIELKQTLSQIDKITIAKLSIPPVLVDKLINYGLTKAKPYQA